MSDDQRAEGVRTNTVCYCGRYLHSPNGRWTHADDDSTFCYPGDPRDGEMRAEPEDG